MKRLLLLSSLFSLLAFNSKAQWLPCVDATLGAIGGTCSVVDSVYGCDGIEYTCADDAMYNHGITHYTHDPNPNFNFYPCHSDFTISESMGVWTFGDSSNWAGGPNPTSAWTFGDGNSSTDYLGTTHTYSSSGYQIVTLTIDDGICSSTTSRVIIASGGGGCNAVFTDSTHCGLTTFYDYSSGSGYVVDWDFGDLSTSDNNPPGNITHQYASSGSYLVIMTIHDGTGACNSGMSDSITVIVPTVHADFTYTTTGTPTNVVTFNNTSTGATSYNWDFADGNTSIENNPTHDYGSACEYEVLLTAFDANGCTSVSDQLVNACITGIPSAPSVLNSMSVYPNPAKDDITVNFNSRKTCDIVLSMKDVTGRNVMESKSVHVYSGENNYKLTLPSLPAGVYLLQVNDESGLMNKSVLIR